MFYSKIYHEFATIESNCNINVWDLKQPGVQRQIKICQFLIKSDFKYIDFIEIEALKVIVIISNTQDIIIFDTKTNVIVLNKNIKVNKIINVIYSKNSHAIILITNDNNIPVIKLEYKLDTYEVNFVGWLLGHLSFIRGACLIDNYNILISIDENSIIKIWSIEALRCLRTIDIKRRSFVKNIIFVESNNSIAIISKKINLFKIELDIENKIDNINNPIIDVCFLSDKKRILVFLKTNYIILECETGKINKIYYYPKQKDSDEKEIPNSELLLSTVKKLNNGLLFYLGDYNGNLRFFDYKLREKKSLLPMGSTIKFIYLDKENSNFIVITANDIYIQNLTKDENTEKINVFRKLNFIYKNLIEIEISECIPSQNLILISSGDEKLLIIDYEFCKVNTELIFPSSESIISIKMIVVKGVLLVVTKPNYLYLYEYKFNNLTSGLKCEFTLLEKFTLIKTTDSIIDIVLRSFENESKLFYQVVVGNSKGEISIYDIKEEIESISNKDSYFNKPSFNYKRIANLSFINEYKNAKKVMVSELLDELELTKCLNYVKFRIRVQVFDQSVKLIKVIKQTIDYLLIISVDNQIKILNLEGKVIGFLRLNDPLPIIWNFKYDSVFHKIKNMKKTLKFVEEFNNNLDIKKSILLKQIPLPLLKEKETLLITKQDKVLTDSNRVNISTMRNQFSLQSLVDQNAIILVSKESKGKFIRNKAQKNIHYARGPK